MKERALIVLFWTVFGPVAVVYLLLGMTTALLETAMEEIVQRWQ